MYSKILSGRFDFISQIHRMHLLVYTRLVSWRLNDKMFSLISVLYNLKAYMNMIVEISIDHLNVDCILSEFAI